MKVKKAQVDKGVRVRMKHPSAGTVCWSSASRTRTMWLGLPFIGLAYLYHSFVFS